MRGDFGDFTIRCKGKRVAVRNHSNSRGESGSFPFLHVMFGRFGMISEDQSQKSWELSALHSTTTRTQRTLMAFSNSCLIRIITPVALSENGESQVSPLQWPLIAGSFPHTPRADSIFVQPQSSAANPRRKVWKSESFRRRPCHHVARGLWLQR